MRNLKSSIAGILLLCLLPWGGQAGYPEFFGASSSTQGIGNQGNLDPEDPANNYYIPALLAWSKTIGFSTALGFVNPDFKKIDNIVINNSSNSDTDERGSAFVDYETSYHGSFHLLLPIAHEKVGNVGFSLFSPLGPLVEAHSGDPWRPEYVMYHSRYKRILSYINYVHALSQRMAFSIGTHLGLQSSVKAYTQSSLNGANYGSSANMHSKVSPSMGLLTSFLFKTRGHHLYFSYQQEMKSNLDAHVFGEINDPTGLLFDVVFETMLYYDPHTFRLGWMRSWDFLSSFFSLEYQLWKSYKPSIMGIRRNSGVLLPSDRYERLELRNILIPKLGLRYDVSDRWGVTTGLAFRRSPLKGDFSGSGNSIDSDTLIYSLGSDFDVRIMEKVLELSISGQYHWLKSKTVVKSPGQENGTDGMKIGGAWL